MNYLAPVIILVFFIITSNYALAVQTNMTVTSQAFKNNEFIPKKYTCDGKNISPPLTIRNVPRNTKSLVLIVDDPDTSGGTFNHWIAWNISPKKHQISEGEKGKFSEGMNGFQKQGYFGPCPPSGIHRYLFKIYALDSQIDISEKSQKDLLQSLIQNHFIQSATLSGKYTRSR